MKKIEEGRVVKELRVEVEKFVRRNPKLKELVWTSFVDHKNRYLNDLELVGKYFKRDGKVLEIGSLPCQMTYCLKKIGFKVVGVDINPKILDKFITRYKLDVRKCDIERQRLPFKNNYFDNILFNEVFEHLRINPLSTLKEINRVMKPGGILILTTPNLYAFHKIIIFNTGMSFNNAYVEFEKLLKYGYMGHIREYSTREVVTILNSTGFKVKKVIYKTYNKFYGNVYFDNLLKEVSAYLMDKIMDFVPRLRQGQIFIVTK